MRRLFIAYVFLSKFCFALLGDAIPLNVPPPSVEKEKRFKITFYCSDKRCCGRHSPQRGGNGNTALGYAPIPFRTAASGDPSLVGKWVVLDDLHGAVFVSDTGVRCLAKKGGTVQTKRGKRRGHGISKGCVAANQLDIFIGGPEWHNAALRLGVQEWTGRVMDQQNSPGTIQSARME